MTWLLGTRIGRALSGFVAAAMALVGIYVAGRRQARTEAAHDALKDDATRMEKGREAVQDIRGSDRSTLVDRLRSNDGRW